MDVLVQHLRCPYCHEEMPPGKSQYYGCKVCLAWQHQECFLLHRKCAACETPPNDDGWLKAAFEVSTPNTFDYLGPARAIEIEQQLSKRLWSDPDYDRVWELVSKNCDGEVRLVGGKVYRNLIEIIHGAAAGADTCDWDWVVTKLAPLHIPNYYDVDAEVIDCYYARQTTKQVSTMWHDDTTALRRFMSKTTLKTREVEKELRAEKRTYKCVNVEQPRIIIKNGVDMMVLNQMLGAPKKWGIWAKDLPISSYPELVPFNFQSIMWEPLTGKLSSQISAIEIIKRRVISIQNEGALCGAAKAKGLSRMAFITQKTAWLAKHGFTYGKGVVDD